MRKIKKEGQVRPERPVKIEYIARFKVNRSAELLDFLLSKCNDSRNNVKSLLTRRQVLVNGSLVTQYNFPLAKDDEVKILKKSTSKDAPTQTRKAVAPRPVPLKILFEDDDFIAVEKPAGLLSVETDKETDCAFARVLSYLSTKGKTVRPFVLHRIDKETSGVLVFAKNIKLHSMLKMRWSELVKTREYYALAEGELAEKSGVIDTFLKENANNLMYVANDPTGQRAITRYETVKCNGEYSLLKVNLETGRKNQIRVHLRHLGHGIVGDEKYGFTKNPIGRLGLHASGIEFEHPVSGALISIHSVLPSEFKAIFNGGKR